MVEKKSSGYYLMEKPILIQANHERGYYVELTTPEDWHKDISIRLEQLDDDVNIHLIMVYNEKGSRNIQKVKAYWPLLIEKIWQSIGVEVTRERMRNLFPISTLNFLLNDLKNEMIGIAGVYSVFFTLFFIFTDMFHIRSNLINIFQITVASILISLLIGGPKYIQVRNLLRDLYPDR